MSYDIVTGEFCSSWYGTYEVQGSRTYHVSLGGEAAHCTCDGFKFRGTCKHITYVYEHACCWNCQWHGGNPDPDLEPVSVDAPTLVPGGECPNCGRSTVPVRIAV